MESGLPVTSLSHLPEQWALYSLLCYYALLASVVVLLQINSWCGAKPHLVIS